MANGDIALAAGFSPVAPGKDIRLGYDDINRLADWVASWMGLMPRREAVGVVNTPALAPSATQTVTITYPSGRFTVAPALFVEPADGRITTTITANSATGATFILNNFTGGSSPVRVGAWHAVQMSETGSAG